MTSADQHLSESYRSRQLLQRRHPMSTWPMHPALDLAAPLVVMLVLGGRLTANTHPIVSALVGLAALVVASLWLRCYRKLGRLSEEVVPGFPLGFPPDIATALQRVCLISTTLLALTALTAATPLVWNLQWPASWTLALATIVCVSATRLYRIASPLRHVE